MKVITLIKIVAILLALYIITNTIGIIILITLLSQLNN